MFVYFICSEEKMKTAYDNNKLLIQKQSPSMAYDGKNLKL